MIFRFDRHTRLRNRLSAYVDGQLAANDVRAVEAHLESCDACRAELDDTRALAAAMRSLPVVNAPRSFALTPEQASLPAPAVAAAPRLAAGMRLASAGVALALAVVVFIDVGNVSDNAGDRGGGLASDSAANGDTIESYSTSGILEPQSLDAGDEERLGDTAADGGAPAGTSEAEVPRCVVTGSTSPGETGSGMAGGGGGPAAATATPAAEAPLTPPPAAPEGDASSQCPPGTVLRMDQAQATSAPESAPKELDETAANQLAKDATASEGDGLSTLNVIEIGLALALAAGLAGSVSLAVAARRAD